jgi:hypothetical protein
VAVAQGEVPDLAHTPSVLLVDVPARVLEGQPFQVGVSTRNILRDRFLSAAQGGYYAEMSVLDRATGVVRGHMHVYAQSLGDGRVAPADPHLAFFKAVEDKVGGVGPDLVRVEVAGLPAGLTRVCVTLGDGSHRPPMMAEAKLAAGVDCVRVRVMRAR